MIVLATGVAPNRTKRHDRRAAAIIGLQVIRGGSARVWSRTQGVATCSEEV